MPLISLDSIVVADRQRKKIDRQALNQLKESIKDNRLLHPIVVTPGPDGTYRLIAGGRRLEAIKELRAEDPQGVIVQGDLEVKTPMILATVVRVEELVKLLTLEYEENVVRQDLSWQEAAEAVAAIHEASVAQNPKHTKSETAKQIQTLAGGETVLPNPASRYLVTRSLTVAENLDRPDIQKAKSAEEAYRMLVKERHEHFEASLAKRRLMKAKAAERLWDLKRGDLREQLVQLPDGQVDLILTDPPYGMGASSNKSDSAQNFHRYEDSEAYALELSIFIIQEGWRLTKPKANLFMFCTHRTFFRLHEAAAKYGWAPWATPIVWRKSAEGEAPWGRLGFTKTHEVFLYATKGQKGIAGPLPDVLDVQKVGNRNRDHPAEKPIELLSKLISVGTIPHDLVLDPCAGSGSTLDAAVRLSRRAIGVELDEAAYNIAMTRMVNVEKEKANG